MVFVTNLTWNIVTSQKVKWMLYSGNVLLRYVLIYNLKYLFGYFNSHITFLRPPDLNGWLKTVFFAFSRLCSSTSRQLELFFRFPLKIRVIRSRLYRCVVPSMIWGEGEGQGRGSKSSPGLKLSVVCLILLSTVSIVWNIQKRIPC